MRRLWAGLAGACVAAGLAFYAATMPRLLPAAQLAALPAGDAARGETWFWAGGCAACHARPKAVGDERLRLGGGLVLKTPFGAFTAPNISPHPEDGIGRWAAADLANAMLRGVSPEGTHYYPAFPYGSYTRMEAGDIADLHAFLQTLPPVDGTPPGHDLAFPFNIRWGLGLWKLAFLSDAPAVALAGASSAVVRGQYLVEGAGHCGECHTPRNGLGGPVYRRWLAGAPVPDGPGRVPSITGGKGGIGDWSEADIAYYLETGFRPDFDTVSGAMVDVQENLAMLTADDRAAIAAYLKVVPELAADE